MTYGTDPKDNPNMRRLLFFVVVVFKLKVVGKGRKNPTKKIKQGHCKLKEDISDQTLVKDPFPPALLLPSSPLEICFNMGAMGKGREGAREGVPLYAGTPAQLSHRAEPVQSNFWFELVAGGSG